VITCRACAAAKPADPMTTPAREIPLLDWPEH
jgi:hypothetical protein